MTEVDERIVHMVLERVGVTRLEHDNLTAFYYGYDLEGRARDANFRRFYWFFHDVENEFQVIFPLSVWDRAWKISLFSNYVEKLMSQPHRSLKNGRDALVRESYDGLLPYLFSALGLVCVILAYFTPPAGIVALVGVLFLTCRKARSILRLRSLLRRVEKKRSLAKTRLNQGRGNRPLDMIS